MKALQIDYKWLYKPSQKPYKSLKKGLALHPPTVTLGVQGYGVILNVRLHKE